MSWDGDRDLKFGIQAYLAMGSGIVGLPDLSKVTMARLGYLKYLFQALGMQSMPKI